MNEHKSIGPKGFGWLCIVFAHSKRVEQTTQEHSPDHEQFNFLNSSSIKSRRENSYNSGKGREEPTLHFTFPIGMLWFATPAIKYLPQHGVTTALHCYGSQYHVDPTSYVYIWYCMGLFSRMSKPFQQRPNADRKTPS